MSAFDRIQGYNSSVGFVSNTSEKIVIEGDLFDRVDSKVFDRTTPTGYFLRALHAKGYRMFEKAYISPDGVTLSESDYASVEASEKEKYAQTYIKTELCNTLLCYGDQLIISAAGSGKTTALIFKIMLDIINGEATKLVQLQNGQTIRVVDSIFVGTFLKTGAEELKTRFNEEQRRFGYTLSSERVTFNTLHAEFYRALTSMNVPIKIGAEDELRSMLKKSIDEMGVKQRGGRALTADDYQILESIITYARGRLDSQRYNHPSVADYENMTPTFIDHIISAYKYKRTQAGIMDFEDLQELLYKYLYVTPSKAVQDAIASRYSYVYLDEFQDTSQIQYAILKFYARGRLKCNKLQIPPSEDTGLYTGIEGVGKIVAIGDDDQCIYGWRGSDIKIIREDFDRDFCPTLSKLTYNYRCPENVLMPVVSSINKNSSRFDKDIRAYKKGGEFFAYHFTSVQAMLEQLTKDIDRDMAEGSTVAILCRTNFDGAIPALALEMQGKYKFSVSSSAMTLSSPLPKKILGMTSLFTERTTKNVQNALEMFVSPYRKREISNLVQTLKNDDANGNVASIWNMDENDIAYSAPSILPIIKALKNIVLDENGVRDRTNEIDGLRFCFKYLKQEVFGGDSAYCYSARAYIDTLLFLLDSKMFTSVFDFQEEVNTYSERLQGRIGRKDAQICIVTVHEFKGKERDSTYVWNDSDMVFPSSKTDVTVVEQVEEERRVHYIACTRAKVRNSIYSLKGKEGMFTKEMDISFTDPIKIGGSLSKLTPLSPTQLLQNEEDAILVSLKGADFNDYFVPTT